MTVFALKRLTNSDLTFFKWHFEHNNAGNQKAINLSRNIFIDRLYPSLPEGMAERGLNKIPVTLYSYGPGLAEAFSLQRKIIKSETYKNWRLNGEFIFDPDENPNRFHVLQAGDIAVFRFEGTAQPETVHIDYLAATEQIDYPLHAVLDGYIGNKRGSMIDIASEKLSEFISITNTPENHPIRQLMDDNTIEDVVQGDAEARLRLYRRTSRTMSRDALKQARQKADEIGELGEYLIADYFSQLLARGKIQEYIWASRSNAIAPFDFEIINNNTKTFLDVKATTGPFDAPLHISMAEIITMAGSPERYDLYRVYSLTERDGKLRIARDMKKFAQDIMDTFASIPTGVRVDSISVDPSSLHFDHEKGIAFDMGDNE